MKILTHTALRWAIGITVAIATLTSIGAEHFPKMTLAPHEMYESDTRPALFALAIVRAA